MQTTLQCHAYFEFQKLLGKAKKRIFSDIDLAILLATIIYVGDLYPLHKHSLEPLTGFPVYAVFKIEGWYDTDDWDDTHDSPLLSLIVRKLCT